MPRYTLRDENGRWKTTAPDYLDAVSTILESNVSNGYGLVPLNSNRFHHHFIALIRILLIIRKFRKCMKPV
jgi:hypothetical protein